MKIFEFYFNPKAQKERIFKIFSFEPEKPGDRKKGNLYMIGELQNTLPSNTSLLTKLAAIIQQEYYNSQLAAEKNLKSALRKANQFLSDEQKNGNVDWIGNLHFTVLLFTSPVAQEKDHDSFYFAKTGKGKIWMTRKGTLADLGKNIDARETDTQKVFGNVVSGSIFPEDKIVVFTQDLFEIFFKQNLLQDLAFIKNQQQFQELFKTKKKELSKVSGILFSVILDPLFESAVQEQKRKQMRLQIPVSLPKIRIPQIKVPQVKMPQIKLPSMMSLTSTMRVKMPRIKLPNRMLATNARQLNMPKTPTLSLQKKSLLSLVFLILILSAGFFLFQDERDTNSREAQEALETAKSLSLQADNALRLKNEERANTLLQTAWSRILPFADSDTPDALEIVLLKKEIEQKLAQLNKIEIIESPEFVFEMQQQETNVAPTRMLLVDESMYLYNPFSSQLYTYSLRDRSLRIFQTSRNITQGIFVSDTIALYAEPNILLTLVEDGTWSEEHILSVASEEFTPQEIKGFGNNAYILDSSSGNILRYENPLVGNAQPILWIDSTSRRNASGAVSFAIDGQIWLMKQDGKIERYFKGTYRESIDLNIFPVLQSPTRIITGTDNPYLYILDPLEQRVVLITKFGDIITQYKSPSFDNLLDIAVSKDGRLLYLLNGSKVYRISTVVLQ